MLKFFKNNLGLILLCVLSKIRIEKFYSLIIVLKNYSGPILTKKVVKKGIAGMRVWKCPRSFGSVWKCSR